MDPKCQAVLDAAMKLSEADRALVAEELLATLSPETTFSTDDELADELDRRFQEAMNDPSATVSMTELWDERS